MGWDGLILMCLGVRLTRCRLVVVHLYGQVGYICNHLGDTPLGTFVRVFPKILDSPLPFSHFSTRTERKKNPAGFWYGLLHEGLVRTYSSHVLILV